MKTIDARARTVIEVLKRKRYGINQYQLKHATLLIADLTAQSLQPCRSSHPRGDGLPKTA